VNDLILRSSVNIRLLNLLNGSPHEVPSQKVIVLDLGYCYDPRVINTRIGGSRIALIIETSDPATMELCRELIVRDWKTGGVVSVFSLWETDVDQNFNPLRCFGARAMTLLSAT